MYLNNFLLFLFMILFIGSSAQSEKTYNNGKNSIGVKLVADIPSFTDYEEYAYTAGISILYQYLYIKGASIGLYCSNVYSPGFRKSKQVRYSYITTAFNPMIYGGYDFRFLKNRLVQSVGLMAGYNLFMHYSNVKDTYNDIDRSYSTALGFLNAGFMAQFHYYIKPNWAIGLSYRYHTMPLTYYYSQNIELGIRYNFKNSVN